MKMKWLKQIINIFPLSTYDVLIVGITFDKTLLAPLVTYFSELSN